MSHKDPTERAKYFREWRSGRRRKDAKLQRLAQEQIAKQNDSNQGIRIRTYLKEKAREQRVEARKETCARLRAEIDRLIKAPFSWQVKS